MTLEEAIMVRRVVYKRMDVWNTNLQSIFPFATLLFALFWSQPQNSSQIPLCMQRRSRNCIENSKIYSNRSLSIVQLSTTDNRFTQEALCLTKKLSDDDN